MQFFKAFIVIQDYEEIEGFWVSVRREFSYLLGIRRIRSRQTQG